MAKKFPAKISVATTVLLCAVFLDACRSQPPAETGSDNLANEAAPLPPMSIVEPPFNRARLLLSVVRAASSHAVGANDAKVQRGLDGKQFEVRIRFGCDGQGPTRQDHGWSVDPDGRILRLRAVPTLSLEDEPVRAVAGDKVEAAEGFWLPRPWFLNASCPAGQSDIQPASPGKLQPGANELEAATTGPDAAASAIQRVGIAQFFTPDDSRTHRRFDRPFEAVKQLAEREDVGRQGFNLVLSGRLRAREDGRVILCAGTGRDRPPDCVVSADVDRVWIERPEDKAVMAEWSF